MKHALVLVAALAATAHAEPAQPHALSATLSFTTLYRNSIDHSGARFAAGYDYQVDRRSSLGVRAGLSVRPDGFGAVVLPYVGVRAHGWVFPNGVPVKLGGGAELWFNSAPVTDKRSEPVMVHVLAEGGPRFALRGPWFVDVPFELGMMGFFVPQVFTVQLGAQLGRRW